VSKTLRVVQSNDRRLVVRCESVECAFQAHDARLEVASRIENAQQLRLLDDRCEAIDSGRVGIERQLITAVTEHSHAFDRAHAQGIDALQTASRSSNSTVAGATA